MITRNRILFIVGLWNILLPFLGFPGYMRTIFIVASGFIAIVLAFMYSRDRHIGVHSTASFSPSSAMRKPSYGTSSHTSSHTPAQTAEAPVQHIVRPDPVVAEPQGFVPPATPRSTRPVETPAEDRFTDLKSILKHTKTF